VRIDPLTDRVVARIPIPGEEPYALAVGEGAAWVGTLFDPSTLDPSKNATVHSLMTHIDPTTNTVLSTVKHLADADGVDAAMVSGGQVVAIDGDALWRIDDTNGTWAQISDVNVGCDCVIASDQPGTIWLADLPHAHVLHIALATGVADRSVHVDRPVGVVVGFGNVWITDQTTKSVIVLSDGSP
jgi:hypothetical protein